MSAARYPRKPVRSLEALRHPLGMDPRELVSLAKRASGLYVAATTAEKEDGTLRVLYDTRKPLKPVLRRINDHFLRPVIYPPYLTGGVPGKDYIDSVRIHAGAKIVIKEDIAKFFPSVTLDVVRDIWSRFFGFSDEVAELLAMLTTRDGHLEQGAPTSGYLANLALWDVEPRLIAQLAAMGVDGYSRHVDDITLSSRKGLSASRIDWIVRTVAQAVSAKGLRLHAGKHQVTHGGEQIKILNLVGNVKPSVAPRERSRVRAIVHAFSELAKAGDPPSAALEKRLPQVRGHAYKIKRLHARTGDQLIARIGEAVNALKARRDKDGKA
jgi:Reverse transcriptase (RNA-dependent DNA polymerase)